MKATDKHRVLVLDSGMLVINHISWKEAIDILLDDKADVIKEYDNVFIKTANKEIPTPAVIRLRYKSTFKRVRKSINYSDDKVKLRDNYTCQYCGTKHHVNRLDIEHVLPRRQGGKTEYKNVVAACKPCNQFKADRTPQQAGMRLLTTPDVPRYFPVIRMREVPTEWQEYMGNDIGIFIKD